MVDATPRLSVVSGYYNRAGPAAASVRSVLEQTFVDFEYLVFDDASSDETPSVLASFDDPRLRVIRHERNVGFVRGMIDAIASTRGPLIAVHGSGDISHPRRLEQQVAYLDSHPDAVAVGVHRRNVAPDGTVLSVVRPEASGLTLDGLRRNNVYSHGEVTYRRAAYDAVGGYRPQFTYSQDRDLWLRMARVGRLGMVDEVLYDRVVQADGVSFVPTKIVRQALFSQLGVLLSHAPVERHAPLLARVERDGVETIEGLLTPALRRGMARKVFALGVAGRWADARELARLLPASSDSDRALRFALKASAAAGGRLDPSGRRLRGVARLVGLGRGRRT